jgi:solute carrier family 12 (sodium/potassium/chloride transporter), member 2
MKKAGKARAGSKRKKGNHSKKKVVLNKKEDVKVLFGAFNGVFVPTFLSIVGVILFLRLGFIVGSAGIIPAILIILLAASVTLATGLSLSSITTNIRIGSGGAYSIISKTLGLEVGGSVGIPLYIAQIFSVTLYLFGFGEVWKYIFPEHNMLVVLGVSFFSIFALTYISTRIAVKAQLFIFAVILVSIVVVLGSGDWLHKLVSTPLFGSFSGFSFWALFALFFPAVTGIMAGVGLSGELEDPKRQIPKGVLYAIGITTVLYVVMALWFAYSASPNELINNTSIIISLASFAPFVVAGILASTFSSALTTFVAAPLLLQAMAEKSIFPGSKFLGHKNARGVPQKAVLLSAVPILLTLAFGNLNVVAPIITMFFLITYAIINVVVFIEQSLGLVSFRPTLNIHRAVPLYGAISSLSLMFFINTFVGMIAVVFVFGSYLFLVKRRLSSKEGDIRSGLFIAFSEWAARKVLTLPESTKHTWKPNVLLPVVNTSTLLGNFPVIKSITYPNGNMTVLGLNIKKVSSSPEEKKSVRKKKSLHGLSSLVKKFSYEGIFTSASTVSAGDYVSAISISLEAIEGQTFPPNVLFLPFRPEQLPLQSLQTIFRVARKHEMGIILSDRDEDVGLGSQEDIHIWLPARALQKDIFAEKGFDLSLLIAYRLFRNWAGSVTVWMCVDKKSKDIAERWLKKLLYEARFPSSTKIVVSTKSFSKTLHDAPNGDIHLIPVLNHGDVRRMKKISSTEEKSFFFIADSGKEDILA